MIKKESSEVEVLSHTKPCSCDACVNGCKFGSGLLANDDKEKIASFLKINVSELEEKHLEEVWLYNKQMFKPRLLRDGKPYGACTFLKEGLCSVHPVKPLQCKVSMPCSEHGEKLIQWFLVNHAVNTKDEFSLKMWEEYLKNNKAIPGGNVKELSASQSSQNQS